MTMCKQCEQPVSDATYRIGQASRTVTVHTATGQTLGPGGAGRRRGHLAEA